MSNSGDGNYVRIIDDGDGVINVLLEVEHDKVLELGDRLGEINEAAYMNGYNWDALIRHYLKNNAPDILEAMDTDPEAGSMMHTSRRATPTATRPNDLQTC